LQCNVIHILAGLDIDLVIRNYFMFIFNIILLLSLYIFTLLLMFLSHILFILTVANDSFTILIYL